MKIKSTLFVLLVSGIGFFSCKKSNNTPEGGYTKGTDTSYTTTLKNELNKRLVMKVYDRTEDYYAQRNAKFVKIFEPGESLVFLDKLINDSSYMDLYAEDFSSTAWPIERPWYIYKNTTIHIATLWDPRPRRVLVKMTDSMTNWVAFDSYQSDFDKTSNWAQLTANQKNRRLTIRPGRMEYLYADNGGIMRDSSWDFIFHTGFNFYLDSSSFTLLSNIVAFRSNYSPSRKKFDGGDDTALVGLDPYYYVMYRQ